MILRRLEPGDAEAVADLAITGLRPDLYPMLRLSRPKLLGVIEHFRTSLADFHLVAFDGNRPVGAVAALVQESLTFERCEAVVVMLFAQRPNLGASLVGALMDWARADIRIRRVTWPLEPDASPAMARYARRQGFGCHNTTVSYLKG